MKDHHRVSLKRRRTGMIMSLTCSAHPVAAIYKFYFLFRKTLVKKKISMGHELNL